MSGWETSDLKEALPSVEPSADHQNGDGDTAAPTATVAHLPPAVDDGVAQAHWGVEKVAYDYEVYTKNTKELHDEALANGVVDGQWASDAARYEWSDEYGDVGPEFPELEAQLFRGDNHVKTGVDFSTITSIAVVQEGPIRLDAIRNFDEAGLHPIMRKNVELAGYDVPTPVQAYCLPAILKGHDVIACAQTGSGKTAAFLVPTLSKLMGKAKKLCAPRPNPAMMAVGEFVRAEPLILVVCPSRELATQIFDEARRFCYRSMFRPCVIYGGGPKSEQIEQLRKGCDVLIGTPGRLCDFIDSPQILTLKRLKYMIIDEADEMLNSDWESELQKIMNGGDQENGNINYMMFSATFPKGARGLAKEHLAHDHVRIRVGRAGSTHKNIEQRVFFIEPSMKRKALNDLLLSSPPSRTIIFVNSKRTADEIDDYLYNTGFPCTSIHSDRTQREREDALRAFRTGKCPIIVATGVSARGLDIHNVMHVINYDLPNNAYGGIDEYIHRIGRTGRAGNKGLASTFYNDRDEELGEKLTKILLEANQVVPDFLEQYVPEGVTATEHENIDFDDNSDDDGEGLEDEDAGGDGGDAWGADNSAHAKPEAEVKQEPASDGWGTPAGETPAAAANGGGWGAPVQEEAADTGAGGWSTDAAW